MVDQKVQARRSASGEAGAEPSDGAREDPKGPPGDGERSAGAAVDGAGAPARDYPDFFTSYMIGIEATWAGIARTEKEARAEQTALIEALLKSSAEPAREWDRQWRKASLLEQMIAPYLSLERLKAEIERRLVEAERLTLATAATFRAAYVGLQGDKATVANLLPLYLTILDDLQWKYTKNRLDRQARFRAVGPLLWYSAIALVLAILPFLAWPALSALAAQAGWIETKATLQALYLAASFGLLGALFSRLSSLQTNFLTLDYDLLSHQFKPRVVWLRMTFGVFGSLVLYFAIFGGLLGGDIFPKPEKLATLSYGAPNADLAKLVVWSFLGGFSERLIPDFLQRTEAQASKT